MTNTHSDVRVIRISTSDVSRGTDHVRAFEKLILSNESSYPTIKRWLHDKVIDGVKTGERVAFVGYQGSRPAISAVVKRGTHSKFCHLRIDEDLQNQNLGDMFFALMAAEVQRFASEVHFTLPERLWAEKQAFFKSFGFSSAALSRTQYRRGEVELRCSAPFDRLWLATRRKLPKLARAFRSGGYHLEMPLLMSLKPRFAEAIFNGTKRYEIRRRFSRRWLGARAAILATRPMGALFGEVTIGKIRHSPPSTIWDSFGDSLGCSELEFKEYCNNAAEVFAIELTEVTPYLCPVPVRQLAHLLDRDLQTPQSYSDLSESPSWREAVSLAAILHGNLTLPPKLVCQQRLKNVWLPNETGSLFELASSLPSSLLAQKGTHGTGVETFE